MNHVPSATRHATQHAKSAAPAEKAAQMEAARIVMLEARGRCQESSGTRGETRSSVEIAAVPGAGIRTSADNSPLITISAVMMQLFRV